MIGRLAARSFSTAARGLFERGVWPIMATPFMPDTEDVDYASFEKSVSFMRSAGASGVTVIGVLGESNRLLDAEREQLGTKYGRAEAVGAGGGGTEGKPKKEKKPSRGQKQREKRRSK